MNQLLTLYCICFELSLPRYAQFNQKNLICNGVNFKDKDKLQLSNSGFYFDDTGNNISYLNPVLGDLTGTYWIWKNTNDEFVGTNQYRRFWNDDEIRNLELNDRTIYIPKIGSFGCNAIDQFINCHGTFGLELLTELWNTNPQFGEKLGLDTFKQLFNIDYIFPAHMFFCHRNLFNRICEVWFDIIFDLYRISFDRLARPDDNRRVLAFLSERILTSLFLDRTRYFGNVDLQPISYVTIGESFK